MMSPMAQLEIQSISNAFQGYAAGAGLHPTVVSLFLAICQRRAQGQRTNAARLVKDKAAETRHLASCVLQLLTQLGWLRADATDDGGRDYVPIRASVEVDPSDLRTPLTATEQDVLAVIEECCTPSAGRRLTVGEIAKRTGLSHRTVSRVRRQLAIKVQPTSTKK